MRSTAQRHAAIRAAFDKLNCKEVEATFMCAPRTIHARSAIHFKNPLRLIDAERILEFIL